VIPAQQAKPSSQTPLQLSSRPLHVSAGGMQLPQAQEPVQVWVPVVPQEVVQVPVVPAQQVHPSSHRMSQSSSMPLQTSAGGMQVPQAQELPQVLEPLVPQDVVQVSVLPAQQVKPLSQVPSQSSSVPLQVSAGGVQEPQEHEEEQVRLPALPQLVVQVPLDPAQHPQPSSHAPSQSSSRPLQTSAGGVQLPQAQEPLQVLEPVVPQEVEQASVLPAQQAKPLSQVPSQSSSAPLQASAGGVQVPQAHEALQVLEPMVPQKEVQDSDPPAQQAKPSSQIPSQSSSMPLQVSAGALQGPQVHEEEQVRLPVLPQEVVQLPVRPLQQPKPSSQVPSRSPRAECTGTGPERCSRFRRSRSPCCRRWWCSRWAGSERSRRSRPAPRCSCRRGRCIPRRRSSTPRPRGRCSSRCTGPCRACRRSSCIRLPRP
jgi:hypothetical protein